MISRQCLFDECIFNKRSIWYDWTYYCCNILNKGFGSATIGIKLKTKEIIWGYCGHEYIFTVHFPLDFKNKDNNNQYYKTMINLQKILKEYDGSICAIGYFNTIPEIINNSINKAISDEFEFVLKNKLTFFGEYNDTIPYKKEDNWSLLI